MPIYEYQCKECGLRFDALRSINQADDLIECQNCTSLETKRVLSTCFSHSTGQSDGNSSSSSHSCGGCSGGSCGSCHH